jgi:hypothetical protein
VAFFMREIEEKYCPNCNKSFDCGGQCWCASYPPIIEVTPNNGCFCPECLHEQMINRINLIMTDLTEENIIKIKNLGPVTNPIEDIDYILKPNGDKEFTQWYNLRNGNN